MENFFKKRIRFELPAIYISNLLLAFHWYLILYINSLFLKLYITEDKIGALFTIGATINLFVLLNISKILKRIGARRLTLLFVFFEFLATAGLATIGNEALMADAGIGALIATFFILHLVVAPMILFMLDIFLESYSVDETKTGGMRSLYLTLSNSALVVSPAIFAFILHDGNFSKVYVLSAIFLLPLFFIITKFLKSYKERDTVQTKMVETIKVFASNKDVLNIFKAHMLLQFFYAWMVIYMSIHLQNIGFDFSQIGVIFTIMLLPFILFEIPLGRLADKKIGEKEILIIGLFIISGSVLIIPFIKEANFLLWTLLLFGTRVGASFVEITTESYFFKHVDGTNEDLISFFRLTRPLSFILAPAVATISLLYLPFTQTFFVLGLLMLWGVRYGLAITDTK